MKNINEDSADLKGAASGDAEAFARLYKRYRNRVYGFAHRMLNVQATAEDVTQEAFLVLIEYPEKYQPERGSVLTFLCAVARNAVLNRFRHRNYEAEDDFEEQELYLIKDEGAPDPLSALLEGELARKIDESIALLPPLQREVIVLRKFQELSYQEISVVTGAEINVVKARLHRARKNLAKNLASYILFEEGERCYELRKS